MLSIDDIRSGLAELARRLDALGIEVSIYLVGGAAVALTVRPDRQLTDDVDSWINHHGDEGLRTSVFDVVAEIGRGRPGFPSNWLNDNAAQFIPESVTGDPADWTPFLAHGTVTIFAARPEVLLAMKLHASRGRRDLPDLPALLAASNVTSSSGAIAVFERFYPHDEIKARAVVWLEAHFAG